MDLNEYRHLRVFVRDEPMGEDEVNRLYHQGLELLTIASQTKEQRDYVLGIGHDGVLRKTTKYYHYFRRSK